MCRVYNTIGCLNTIQSRLVENDFDEFNSVNELISFQKNYLINEQKIISDHTTFIQEEKTTLEKDICELNLLFGNRKNELKNELRQKLDLYNTEIENLTDPNSKIIATIKDYWMNLIIHIKFWFAQLLFYFKIFVFMYQAKKILSKKTKHLEYISLNFQDAVNEGSYTDLNLFQRKKSIIENLNNTIYGAIGEKKVEEELKKLSDNYILINNFCCSFEPPIYNQKNNDYIKTIQIDHLLISPSGIFLIETKNWSNHSIENRNLRSPVEQVHRTSFALFKTLTEQTKKQFGIFPDNIGEIEKYP